MQGILAFIICDIEIDGVSQHIFIGRCGSLSEHIIGNLIGCELDVSVCAKGQCLCCRGAIKSVNACSSAIGQLQLSAGQELSGIVHLFDGKRLGIDNFRHCILICRISCTWCQQQGIDGHILGVDTHSGNCIIIVPTISGNFCVTILPDIICLRQNVFFLTISKRLRGNLIVCDAIGHSHGVGSCICRIWLCTVYGSGVHSNFHTLRQHCIPGLCIYRISLLIIYVIPHAGQGIAVRRLGLFNVIFFLQSCS